MTVVVAACAALGLLLLYDGLTGKRSAVGISPIRRLDQVVLEAGVRQLNGVRLIGLSVVVALTSGLFVAGISSSALIAGIFCAAAGWLPYVYVSSKRQRRQRRFREAWPDAIHGLISGVRAGVSLAESCDAQANKGPEELRPGFVAFAGTYRSTGNLIAGLERLRSELSDPVADRVVASLTLASEVGGTDLVRVLRTLADFVREDIRVRKEIEARWSWTVTAARVAAASPWVVLLLMSTRPEAARAYNSAAGATVITAGAVATFVGYRLMLRAARLPEERRLR
ncbi:MAG: type II secretion system protein F [Actinobacteria bacterium]|nr:type II secretion system protein F [Actinomycetota bacterium]